MYIGLLWMFHGDAGETKLNRLMGYMDCQLVYSYNGKIFQRICHRPFIARSRQGEHGGGSVFPTSVVEDKNHIYIYMVVDPKVRCFDIRKKKMLRY